MAELTVKIEPGDVAERAIDEILYKGRTIREWADLLTSPKTNSDRIRAMSDEDLAEWISNRAACSVLCPRTCSSGFEDCKPAWLDWLKSPAEGEA